MKINTYFHHPQIKTWSIIVFIFIFNLDNSCGQEISIINKNSFEYKGITYDRYSLSSVLEGNEEAHEYYNIYLETTQNKQKERLAGAIGMVGGAIVTYYYIISALSEKDNPTLVYAGLVTFAIGSGLMIVSLRPKDHYLQSAIRTYNENIPSIGMQFSKEIRLTEKGIGIVYNF